MILLSHPWIKTAPGTHQAGRPSGAMPSLDNIFAVREWLVRQRVHFGIVRLSSKNVFACVDRTRSFPLFYAVSDGTLYLADQPDKLKPYLADSAPDEAAIALYLSSGYCQGGSTMLKDVRQLQPGECLLWDAQKSTLAVESYYDFVPRFPDIRPGRDEEAALGDVLDRAIARVIDQAAGRTIWVPLSGGLDSRAVLCKLHEKNYPHLQAFSYGAAGNTEAKTASRVAGDLGVPWRFVEPDYVTQQRFFESDDATNFMRYAMRLSSGPSFTDFFALRSLHGESALGPDALIVNGQSGDYITGGHLPKVADTDDALEKLTDYFLKKHFSLWTSLEDQKKTTAVPFLKTQYDYFSQRFPANDDNLQTYRFYTWLEWRERQSKYVVACQSNYDYFGLDWALPLWDSDLMDFYADLPFEQFIGQKLYIDYLKRWNYKNLFSFIREPYNPWPRNRAAVLGAGRAVGILKGPEAKQSFYRFMRYWSSHDVHFKLMPLSAWKEIWRDLENAEGFYALAGLLRSGIAFDERENASGWQKLVTEKSAHLR